MTVGGHGLEIPLPIVIALGLFGLGLAARRGRARKVEALRRSGLLPAEGEGTMEDVRRLAEGREMIEAIKLYRQLHRCDLKTAKEAVEALRETATGTRKDEV